MSKKLTVVIPARGGSKGVPRKNIKMLKGHPLISYSIIASKESHLIGRVVVSTDDSEIAEISESYGAEVLKRPAEFAQDNSTDWQVINHFFQSYDVNDVIYFRPTTPLRNPNNIDECIKFYLNNRSKMTGLRSMHELPEGPYKVFRLSESGYCEGFFKDFNGIKDYTNLPRQTFPKAYHPNGYIDIAKRETVESGKSAFATKILPYVSEFVTEVDAQYEFDLLNFQLSTEENVLLKSLKEKFGDS